MRDALMLPYIELRALRAAALHYATPLYSAMPRFYRYAMRCYAIMPADAYFVARCHESATFMPCRHDSAFDMPRHTCCRQMLLPTDYVAPLRCRHVYALRALMLIADTCHSI